MIAVLDHRQYDVIARQPMRQRECMLPWHIRILRALQNANRAPHVDGAAEQQMVAALLNQGVGDRIRLAVLRRSQPNALGLDLLADFGRKSVPHQLFGKIRRRCYQHQPAQRRAVSRALRDLPCQQ